MKRVIGSICIICSLLISVNIYAAVMYRLDVSDLPGGKVNLKLSPNTIGEWNIRTGQFEATIYNQNSSVGELSDVAIMLQEWLHETENLYNKLSHLLQNRILKMNCVRDLLAIRLF